MAWLRFVPVASIRPSRSLGMRIGTSVEAMPCITPCLPAVIQATSAAPSGSGLPVLAAFESVPVFGSCASAVLWRLPLRNGRGLLVLTWFGPSGEAEAVVVVWWCGGVLDWDGGQGYTEAYKPRWSVGVADLLERG